MNVTAEVFLKINLSFIRCAPKLPLETYFANIINDFCDIFR